MARLGWPAPKRAGQPGYFSGRQLCRDSESARESLYSSSTSTALAVAAALAMPILTKGFGLHLASNRERDRLERRRFSPFARPIDLVARSTFAQELHTEVQDIRQKVHSRQFASANALSSRFSVLW